MTEPTAPRTISLQDIGRKYSQALQHLSDLTVYVWAGSRSVSEEAYDDLSRNVPGLPSTEFRLNFETAKTEVERAWLKQNISEAIGLTYVFIEDVRKLAGLATFNAAKATGSGDLTAIAAELNAPPKPADLVTRLGELRERYGISTDYDDAMISLSKAARTLLHTNGVLGPDETCELTLKVVLPPEEGQTQARVANFEREWKANERIYLNRNQHAAVFTTISLFFAAVLNALQEYAKRIGLPQEPARQ